MEDSYPTAAKSPEELSTSNKYVDGDSIKVIVRIRPLLGQELQQFLVDGSNNHSLQMESPATSVVIKNSTSLTVSTFNDSKRTFQCTFDAVLSPQVSQQEVYDHVQDCTIAAMQGINSTIFAYGQTGSGKTFSMYGPPNYNNNRDLSLLGVIPRTINHIFDLVKQPGILSFHLYCSFVQIYNENLYDMLRDASMNNPLTIREESNNKDIFVQGLSEYTIKSIADALQLLKIAEENRAIRETHMNQFSSRSHSIFQIFIEHKRVAEDGGEASYKAKFNLVDLAGSEKWDTKRNLRDEHIAEMNNINLSLHTLGKCISALAKQSRKRFKSENNSNNNAQVNNNLNDWDSRSLSSQLSNSGLLSSTSKNQLKPLEIPMGGGSIAANSSATRTPSSSSSTGHIPFRESKLTRLLQDSLGGRAKTILIATVSPARSNCEETISTLKFADRAKQVMVQAIVNETRPVDHAMVKQLQQELQLNKSLLRKLLISSLRTIPAVTFPVNNNSNSIQRNFPHENVGSDGKDDDDGGEEEDAFFMTSSQDSIFQLSPQSVHKSQQKLPSKQEIHRQAQKQPKQQEMLFNLLLEDMKLSEYEVHYLPNQLLKEYPQQAQVLSTLLLSNGSNTKVQREAASIHPNKFSFAVEEVKNSDSQYDSETHHMNEKFKQIVSPSKKKKSPGKNEYSINFSPRSSKGNHELQQQVTVERGSGLEYVISLEKALNKEQIHAQHLTKKNETLIKEIEELKFLNLQLNLPAKQAHSSVTQIPAPLQQYQQQQQQQQQQQLPRQSSGIEIPEKQALQVVESVEQLLKQHDELWNQVDKVQKVMKKFFKYQIEEDDMKDEIGKIFEVVKTQKKEEASSHVHDNFSFLQFAIQQHHSLQSNTNTLEQAPVQVSSSGSFQESDRVMNRINNRELPTLSNNLQRNVALYLQQDDRDEAAQSIQYRVRGNPHANKASKNWFATESHHNNNIIAPHQANGGAPSELSQSPLFKSLREEQELEEERVRRELKAAKKKLKEQERLDAWMKQKEERAQQEQQAQDEERKAMQEAEAKREAKRKEYAQKQKEKLQAYQDKVKAEAEKIQELVKLGIDPKSLNF